MNIIGASGHAKVIIDVLESRGVKITGIYDKDPNIASCLGYPVTLSTETEFIEGSEMVLAVGDNRTRERIYHRLGTGFSYPNIAHAAAYVSKWAEYGPGSVIMAGAVVQPDARIGKQVIINTGAAVDHDCIISDFVHIAPHATLCGGVKVGHGSLIGAGSRVIPGVSIGKNVIVGAGTTVLRNVADGEVVYGIVK